MTRKNKLTLALALIAGIAFVVIMVKLKQPPERAAAQAAATPVRIMEVTPREFRTEARGYGQVLPAQTWNAVANVGGRVIWKHPDLESGNLIAEGTRLLEIDPTAMNWPKPPPKRTWPVLKPSYVNWNRKSATLGSC